MSNLFDAFDSDIQGLGVGLQPGLAQAYPDIVAVLNDLYEARVRNLPWLPVGWLESVREVQAMNPMDLVEVRRKTWDTAAETAAWRTLADDTNRAVAQFAAGKASEGRAIISARKLDSAFWNAAYKAATVVGSVPAAIGRGAGSVVSDALDGAFGALSGTTRTILVVAALGVATVYLAPLLKLARK